MSERCENNIVYINLLTVPCQSGVMGAHTFISLFQA